MTDTDMDIDLDLDAEIEKELTAAGSNAVSLTNIDADLEAELLGEPNEQQQQHEPEQQQPQQSKEPQVQTIVNHQSEPTSQQPTDQPTTQPQEEQSNNYDQFEALPRRTAIFLHGVDNLSTTEIESYVDSPLLAKVEWINDSSCNLVCNSQEDATALAQTLLKDDSQIQTLDHRTLVPAKPFIVKNSDGTQPSREDPLFIRIATDEDIKERGARFKSRYYLTHGDGGQPLSQERQEARIAHVDRMTRNGGDGRDVFSRLGKRSAQSSVNDRRHSSQSQRSRSRSPTRQTTRTITKRPHKGNMELSSSSNGRKREIQIPRSLLSRLGPMKQKTNDPDADSKN